MSESRTGWSQNRVVLKTVERVLSVGLIEHFNIVFTHTREGVRIQRKSLIYIVLRVNKLKYLWRMMKFKVVVVHPSSEFVAHCLTLLVTHLVTLLMSLFAPYFWPILLLSSDPSGFLLLTLWPHHPILFMAHLVTLCFFSCWSVQLPASRVTRWPHTSS